MRTLLLAALLAGLSCSCLPAQDVPDPERAFQGIGGPPEVRPVLRAEQLREAVPGVWRAFLDSPDAEVRRAALRGIGRVAAPQLKPLLAAWLGRPVQAPDARLRRAEALAVGLFGEPDLLPQLLGRCGVADLARATGFCGRLPRDPAGRRKVVEALQAQVPEGTEEQPRETLGDPTVARLTYGMRLKEPLFRELALAVLRTKSSPQRKRAAAYYFARHAGKTPKEAAELLAGLLESKDTETAGYAARAIARIPGGAAPAGALIAAAYEKGGPRLVQVDRLRALARCAPTQARPAVLLGLGSGDAHLRRTALETAAALAKSMTAGDRRGLATFAATMAEVDPQVDVRRAAVLALAALDPKGFLKGRARYLLAGPWQLRAAAASALGGMAWTGEVAAFAHHLARDPDRRVRQAVLEAAARGARASSARETLYLLQDLAASWDLAPGAELPRAVFSLPSDIHDPVELGLRASLARAIATNRGWSEAWKGGADWRPFLQTAAGRLPPSEVEPWLAVLDLARTVAGDAGKAVLDQAARGPEPALRNKSRALLDELKLDAPRVASVGPSFMRAWTRRLEQPVKIAGLAAGAPGYGTTITHLDRPGSSAVIHSLAGDIAVTLHWQDAPVACTNFLKLAREGFYDGILFHRVVPAFVAQAGCPRGDGWGGPGYTIPCENSDRTYRRGSLGMALAGKDTGGSQWFLCHRPAPHLDGRYTLFGEVTKGLDVLDALMPGDVITSITVVPPR